MVSSQYYLLRLFRPWQRVYLWQGCSQVWTASTHFFYEMIRYVRFMYVCDLARVWHSLTSYGVHPLLMAHTHTSFLELGPTPLIYGCVGGRICLHSASPMPPAMFPLVFQNLHTIAFVQHFTRTHLYLERHVWNMCKNSFGRNIYCALQVFLCALVSQLVCTCTA